MTARLLDDAFVLGSAKLDLLFGRTTLDTVRFPYHGFVEPGVHLLRESVIAIDPHERPWRMRLRLPDSIGGR